MAWYCTTLDRCIMPLASHLLSSNTSEINKIFLELWHMSIKTCFKQNIINEHSFQSPWSCSPYCRNHMWWHLAERHCGAWQTALWQPTLAGDKGRTVASAHDSIPEINITNNETTTKWYVAKKALSYFKTVLINNVKPLKETVLLY